MQVHRFIALPIDTTLKKARASSLDLDLAMGSLLDVLDVRATLTYHLSS